MNTSSAARAARFSPPWHSSEGSLRVSSCLREYPLAAADARIFPAMNAVRQTRPELLAQRALGARQYAPTRL